MASCAHRFLTTDDLGPLLRIAAHEDTATCAPKPSRCAPRSHSTNRRRGGRGAGSQPFPGGASGGLLEEWAADDGSAHQDAVRRPLATPDRPAVTPWYGAMRACGLTSWPWNGL